MDIKTGRSPNVSAFTYKQQAEEVSRVPQEKVDKGTENTASTGDSVEFSNTARLMAEASNTARATSDVRQGKVGTLREQVQGGTYAVDGYAIATGIVKEDMFVLGS